MRSTRVRVLHAFDLGEIGGLFRIVQMLSTAQVASGHDVHVAVVVGSGAARHPLEDAIEQAGATLHRIEIPPRGYRAERAAFRRLLERVRPTVVHTHGYRCDVLDSPIARRLGVPTLTTVHGFTGGDWKNRLYERLQVRSFRKMDAVVAVSAPLKDLLRRKGVPESRLRLVRNGWVSVDPPLERTAAREALGVEPSVFHIGWVGRLSAEKGPDVFIDALARLEGGGIVATVVGDGPLRDELQTRAHANGGAEVRWAGAVQNAARYFKGFDLIVMSSRTEGTPVVLLEAMACGVPVATTAVGGIPDVIGADQSFMVESPDPELLAAAIRAAESDPEDARQRAARAELRLSERAASRWVSDYQTIYEDISR